MPFGVEMLHLLGMEVLGDWWWGGLVGQFLVALYAPAAAVLIAAATARRGSPRGGLAGGDHLPVDALDLPPGRDRLRGGPALLLPRRPDLGGRSAAGTTRPRRERRSGGLLGLLAGGAMGCKYPALISAVIPFGLLALVDASRSRSCEAGGWHSSLGWSIVMVPWLAQERGRHRQPGLSAGLPGLRRRALGRGARGPVVKQPTGPRTITASALWSSLVDVAGRSDWQSPLYLAFAPLALLRRRSQENGAGVWPATRPISS